MRRVNQSPVAATIPFDNTGTTFTSLDTQAALIEAKVFGEFFQNSEAAAETSTTSTTTFLNKVTLTTPVLTLGTYIIKWNFKYRAQNASRFIDVRVQRAAVNIKNYQKFYPNVSERPNDSGYIVVSGISGIQTFTLDFKVSGSGTTVYMSEAYLTIWRVL